MDTLLPDRSAPYRWTFARRKIILCNTSSSSSGQSQMRVELNVLAGAVSFPTLLISITSRPRTSHGLLAE